MKKSLFSLVFIAVLAFPLRVWGAEPTFPEVMQENREMRKNITRMTEGLYQLGKSWNKRLALTKGQARRILPLYRELIEKKIILIEIKPERPGDSKQRNSARNSNGPGVPGAPGFASLRPEEKEGWKPPCLKSKRAPPLPVNSLC